MVDQGSERRRKREASPEHQALIEHFVAVYQRARGVPPVVDAKEHVGCNRLLAGRSLDDARAIVDRGFADPFVAEKKPSLAFIAANVNAYQGVQPETPSGVRRVASAPRPEQQGNPNPVSREFELTPFDEARIAAARADREQKGRADVAATRQESEPTRAFGERS